MNKARYDAGYEYALERKSHPEPSSMIPKTDYQHGYVAGRLFQYNESQLTNLIKGTEP